MLEQIPQPRTQGKCETPTLGQKHRAKTPPLGQLFSKIQRNKTTKHEIEIMKNSTNANMFGNIKTVKHIEAQSFLVGRFYGYSKYLKSFSIHYKPTQEIHDKQVPKYALIDNNC